MNVIVNEKNLKADYVYLNDNHVNLLQQFFNFHPICKRCSIILQDHSLGDGFMIKSYKDYDKKSWLWFLQELFENLLKFGFCVYYIDKKKKIPVVTPFGTTTLRYYKDNLKYNVEVLDMFTKKPLKKHYVFVDSLFDEKGQCISPVSKAYLAQVENNNVIRNVMEQERSKAFPKLYGIKKDKNPSAKVLINTQNDLNYSVTESIMKQKFDLIREEQEKIFEEEYKKNTNKIIEETEFDRLEVVQAQASSINLTELNRQFRQQICTSMGVPSSFIVDDSVVKVNTEGTTVSFYSSLNYWKHKLMEAILTIFEIIDSNIKFKLDDIHLLGYLYAKDVEYLFENRILKDSSMKIIFSRRFHIPESEFVIPDLNLESPGNFTNPNSESVTKKRGRDKESENNKYVSKKKKS